VGEYNSLNQVVNQVEYSNTTTSVELPANQYGYVVIAYYNDANAKYSNKITITEATPAFTTQPVGGEVAPGEKLNVTWATNFTPKKLQVLKYSQGYCTGTQTLDVNATTANVSAGDEYCIIRAYYSDSNYVDSNKFYVSEKVSGSGVTVSGTITSYLVDEGDITVQLLSGEEIAYSQTFNTYTEVSATKTEYATEYSITGVVDGTYTLRVSKEHHVTRDYTLTVSGGVVTQDLKIHLLGDINGDGKANATDKKKIYAHINDSSKALTGYEFQVANVNGDDKVNATDKKKIFAHINGNTLW
jgi:hypothetical protein